MLTYKILGPLEVIRDGEALLLGPAKQRALLACLLLRANETVSRDRLIDDLWDENPPARADQNLFQYVFRLRKILDDGGREVLVRRDPGYLIRLGDGDELDARRFEDLLERSRDLSSEDLARVLETLDEALALWRGPALADFSFENFAQPAASRLEELRVVAEEGRIEALLALDRHTEAIPELRSLVQRHPVREHLRALLALALYRAGRQTEALNAIQSGRQALASELGIDPGPELRQLEEAILRQDPALDVPVPTPEPPTIEVESDVVRAEIPAERARRRQVRRRRSRRKLVVATVVLSVAIVIAAVALVPKDEPPEDQTKGSGPIPSPTPTVVEGLNLSWDKAAAELFEEDGEQRILGGVRTQTGYLAYGFSVAAGDYDTAAWFGGKQQRWHRSESPSFVGDGNSRATNAWVFDNGSILLVGWVEPSGNFDAAVWRLRAGATEWDPVSDQDSALGGELDQQIRDATLIGSTLLAVGYTLDPTDLEGAGKEPAIWEGPKFGRSWRYLGGEFEPDPGDQEMASVAHVKSSGLTVAAGYSELDGERDAAVWTFRNDDWKRVMDQLALGGEGDQQINEVIPYQGGFVAVGEQTTGEDIDAVVWTSRDGETWLRVGDEEVLGGSGDQQMYTVAASDRGIVAAGREVTADDWDAAVWTSVNGSEWERLPGNDLSMTVLTDIGYQEIKGLMATDDGFLAFGSEGTMENDLDARVWKGTPSS